MDELGFACRAVLKTKPLRSGLWDFGLFPDGTRSCGRPEQAWLAASGAQAAVVLRWELGGGLAGRTWSGRGCQMPHVSMCSAVSPGRGRGLHGKEPE